MDDAMQARRPLSREQFADLRRGDSIRERRGRSQLRTVMGDPYDHGRECVVVHRSGDLVRVERQRFADGYILAESPELHLPAPVR